MARGIGARFGTDLGDFGVQNFLANPKLDLVDASGTVLRSNDSWKSSQGAQIQAANLAPKYDAEAALVHYASTGPIHRAPFTALN
jgi:hypothetical protein